jgi:uncharacterized protein YjbI with pentapeptide repeats
VGDACRLRDAVFPSHALWLADDQTGERANLTGADLRGADLWRADLRDADLSEANLIGAALTGAIQT